MTVISFTYHRYSKHLGSNNDIKLTDAADMFGMAVSLIFPSADGSMCYSSIMS